MWGCGAGFRHLLHRWNCRVLATPSYHLSESGLKPNTLAAIQKNEAALMFRDPIRYITGTRASDTDPIHPCYPIQTDTPA